MSNLGASEMIINGREIDSTDIKSNKSFEGLVRTCLVRTLYPDIQMHIERFCGRLRTLFGLVPWVNVYTVSRAFGGTEAGENWYYRKYTCIDSRQVWFKEADLIQLKLRQRFSALTWGNISSETRGQEVAVFIEKVRAALETTERPTYHSELVIGTLPEEYPLTAKSHHAAVDSTETIAALQSHPKVHASSKIRVYRSTSEPRKLINSLLEMSGLQGRCVRCGGTGKTQWTHIKNGICFKCKGEGSM